MEFDFRELLFLAFRRAASWYQAFVRLTRWIDLRFNWAILSEKRRDMYRCFSKLYPVLFRMLLLCPPFRLILYNVCRIDEVQAFFIKPLENAQELKAVWTDERVGNERRGFVAYHLKHRISTQIPSLNPSRTLRCCIYVQIYFLVVILIDFFDFHSFQRFS